ncbi:glycine betaine ABC transporter substrate-binding protein [Halomonas sp.]
MDQGLTLTALLDDATMAELNARVDVERQSVEEVAEAFLKTHELL